MHHHGILHFAPGESQYWLMKAITSWCARLYLASAA